jgi:hypothetical protein
MKLELKHLAPYLPYELKYMDIPEGWNEQRELNIRTIDWLLTDGKPILRPLSDFNYREVYGYPNREMFYKDVENQTIMVKIWNELLTDHIDVFGLIEKGLAIDINTI